MQVPGVRGVGGALRATMQATPEGELVATIVEGGRLEVVVGVHATVAIVDPVVDGSGGTFLVCDTDV